MPTTKVLFHSAISNPLGPEKNPWHVTIGSDFPDRVVLTNPNDQLVGQDTIDRVLSSREIPVNMEDISAVALPETLLENMINLVWLDEMAPGAVSANPFAPQG